MENQYKLAVIGSGSSILIYRAIGVETVAVTSDEEARQKLEELVGCHFDDEQQTPEYATIFVEENFYQNFPDDLIGRLAKKPLPAVVPVPSPIPGKESFAMKRLSKIVEKAVGSDIFG